MMNAREDANSRPATDGPTPAEAGTHAGIPVIRCADDLHSYLDAPPGSPCEITDEHLVAILRFFHAIGYRNCKDKDAACPWGAGQSDIVRLKTLSPVRYHMFTMPRLDAVAHPVKLRRSKFGTVLAELYEDGMDGTTVLVQANMPKRHVPDDKGWNQAKADGAVYLKYTTHLVLESDGMAFEDQFRIRDALAPWLSAAVFSGGKSLHLWVRLEREGVSSGTPCFSYLAAKERILRWIREHGASVDMRVFNDLNRWVRVPCMPRQDLMTLPVAVTDRPVAFGKGMGIPDPKLSRRYGRAADAVVEPRDASRARREMPSMFEAGLSDREAREASGGIVDNETASIHERADPSSFCRRVIDGDTPPDFHGVPSRGGGGSEEEEEQVHITVIHFAPNPAGTPPTAPGTTTFIDLVSQYKEAILNGFPSVGTRQQHHYVLLSIRRVMGWDDRELVEVFKEILERSAGRYRCTYEEAVDDFVSHVKASRNAGGVRMPDLTGQALPGDAGDRIVSYLGKRAGRDAGRVARLVTGYLWEKALVNPSMAWRGELGIKAVEMRAVVGARYWPSVKRVMAEENLLVETRECIPNRRTRRYMVNLPLLLWIVWGGRQHELRWELASRKAACERGQEPQRDAA